MLPPAVHPDAVWAVLLSEAALSVMCGALSVRTRHSRDALLRVEAALTLVTGTGPVSPCHHAIISCQSVVILSSLGQQCRVCSGVWPRGWLEGYWTIY